MNFETSTKVKTNAGDKIKDTLLNFIVPLISLGVILLLVFTIIIPYKSKIPQLETQLTSAEQLRGKLQTKVGVLKKLEDFETVVQEDVKTFEQALPEEAMVPELLTQVDAIARESGLEVSKLSYSVSELRSEIAEAEKNSTYKAIIINLGVKGGYDQIETFLKNLEISARVVNANSIRISNESGDDESTYLTTFILSAPYLFVESQAVTDAEVTVDISNTEFLKVLEKAKGLKFYDVTASTQFLEVEESELEEVTEAGEEETTTPEATPETPTTPTTPGETPTTPPETPTP